MPISADLGETLEAYAAGLVKAGRYASTDDVLRDAMLMLQDRETKLAMLDAAIARGIASAEAGRGRPMDEVFDELEVKYRAMIDVAAE